MHAHVNESSTQHDSQVVASLEGLRSGDGDVFHAAVEAVCELIWCTVDPESASVQPAMMPLIQVCLGGEGQTSAVAMIWGASLIPGRGWRVGTQA